MKTNNSLSIAALAVALLVAVSSGAGAPEERLKILTTTTDLASIARAVGGDAVEVTSLMTGPEDPHFLTAKPSFIRRAHDADVFIKVGLDLEIGYEGPIVRDARNARIQPGAAGHCDASVGIAPPEVPVGAVDRSMGDVHPGGNPHYLLDPVRAKTVAARVAESMAASDPARATVYRDGAKRFAARVDESLFGAALLKEAPVARLERMLAAGTLGAWLREHKHEDKIGGWAKEMLPFAGAAVADYHSTFAYLAHRFHVDASVRLEQKPGIPPSPRQLRAVIETLVQKKIGVILHCTFQPAETVRTVATETGGSALLLAHQPGATESAGDWFSMMDDNVRRLAAALRAAKRR